jgi:VanZ family protein
MQDLTPNLELRTTMRPFALALGWILVAVVIWLSVTPSPPTIDVDQGDKLGHLVAYGTLMFWFAQLYVRSAVRLRYALGFIGLGIALEFVQGHIGRDFEVADMAADAFGVALGWAGALVVRLEPLGRR